MTAVASVAARPTLAAPMQIDAARRIALEVVLLSIALLPAAALAWWIDPRLHDGVSVWAKPLKFDASFALHWLIIAWLLTLLPAAVRERRGFLVALRVAAFSTLVELLYIGLQAARGRASHFNTETPWEAVLYYGVMGGGAVLIVAVTFVVGWLLWRHAGRGSAPGLARGAALGLMLGAAATLAVAAPLAAGVIDGPGHWVGGIRSDTGGLPLFGWSTSGGDLRVPHFFATHLAQALPLAGWLADRLRARRPERWVGLAAGIGLLAVAATFVQAASGRPLIPLSS